jgi:type 1 fimbriae regulatory protein FimB/type 1 fimbriae regulatory protein FimE
MGEMAFTVDGASTPTIVNSSVARPREYLTTKEVEDLMAAARKSSRHGHRDATMILIAYRHGLRACEVCDLQWHQVELNVGRLHVRRSKRGTPSASYGRCAAYNASGRLVRMCSARSAVARSRQRASTP